MSGSNEFSAAFPEVGEEAERKRRRKTISMIYSSRLRKRFVKHNNSLSAVHLNNKMHRNGECVQLERRVQWRAKNRGH